MADQVDSREQQPRYRYVSLVSPDEEPKLDRSDDHLTHIVYSKKVFGDLGKGRLMITKTNGLDAADEFGEGDLSTKIYIADSNGIRPSTLKEAMVENYGPIQLDFEQPVGNYLGRSLAGGVSTDGVDDVLKFSSTVTDASDERTDGGGNHWSIAYFTGKDLPPGKDAQLFAPANPDVLSIILFRFNLKGGDV